ncbi:hypothetical protein EK21DRAFT_118496 [Setomelanomma holmii]|uniref:Rhodopsin domain-containing protein n=1 Tax=Setomelanomma holmii TaxID=210430 RepID=A0A9P4GY87_9PLEO|nr:hypothetical protein EK21DRAFT_118496 [Setomelanomma holmii]
MATTVDLGPTLTIFVVVALSITTVAVGLRCYVRIFLQHRFAPDDYLIMFSLANLIAFVYCVLHQIQYGHGKHLSVVLMDGPSTLRMALKFWWIAQPFYIFANCAVKVSVAVFFCSLCPPRSLHLTAIIAACASAATGLGTLLLQILQCQPVAYFWDRFEPAAQGKCLDPHKAFAILQTVNACDIATDVVLALLPCIMVWNMTMELRKKFCVSLLLGMGALPVIAAIIRAFYFKNMLLNTSDFTFTAWPITITSVAEPAVGITAVCLAQLRPLGRKIFPKGWFTISELPPSDIVTFGRPGACDGPRITVISLNTQLKTGPFNSSPSHHICP